MKSVSFNGFWDIIPPKSDFHSIVWAFEDVFFICQSGQRTKGPRQITLAGGHQFIVKMTLMIK